MSTTSPRVLVADDHEHVRVALELLLRSEGFEVTTVDSPAGVLAALDERAYDAALVDLNYTRDTTSGSEGLDLVRRAHAAHPHVALLVMTAWGTLELAVAAMKRGARDFVLKPWDNAALVRTLQAQARSVPRSPLQELDLARRVQAELLPHREPVLRTLELAACCVQAGAVGGDAYDFLDLGPGLTGITLADASGRGVSAALLMANLIGCLRSEARRPGAEPAATLRAVNAQFFASTAPEHYATLFFGLYDEASRGLRYVNCGHNPPLLRRAGGRVERLSSTAPVLGLFAEWSCEVAELTLLPGDALAIYSDGLSDAESPADEAFGEARIEAELQAGARLSAPALRDALLDAVARFAGDEHDDDRTLIVARCVA
jgi:sigma-B regulation protein RsbU (phosphoserine phosphatase)